MVKKNSLFANFSMYLPFALLFGLIPYRFCGIFHLDYTSRLLIGLLCFFSFFYAVRELIIVLLNTMVVQLLFYFFLSLEDFVRGMKPFYQYAFVVSFSFSLGGWPALTEDPMFWYTMVIFFLTFYRQMCQIFVNPQFEASSYLSMSVQKMEALTWDLILMNMSTICLSVFGQPIQNQLGRSMSQRSFNQISKRYVWGKVFGFAKTHPEAVTVFSSLAGGAGVVWGLYNQKEQIVVQKQAEENAMLRHKEQMDFQKNQMDFQKKLEENAMLRHKEHMDFQREQLDLEKLKLTGKVKDLSYKENCYVLDYPEHFSFFTYFV